MTHAEAHELAGTTVTLELTRNGQGIASGAEFTVEDWWDRITGKSWMFAQGNPAALAYAGRAAALPLDDEVVYGKIGGLGHLVHVSELGERVSS